MNYGLIGSLLSLLCACFVAVGADPFEEAKRSDALARAGKGADAQRIAATLAGNQNSRRLSIVLSARLMQIAGRDQEALAAIRDGFPNDTSYDGMSSDEILFAGDTLRLLKQYDAAVFIADRIGKQETGRALASAAALKADAFSDCRRWKDALEWIDIAIRTMSTTTSSEDGTAFLTSLRQRQKRYEDAIDLETHGIGFSLYKAGNEHRFAKRYADAIVSYDRLIALHQKNGSTTADLTPGVTTTDPDKQPIPEVYHAAAQAYRAECLVRMDRFSDAAKAISTIISDKNNPYRGECLRLSGDAALLDKGEIATAEQRYSEAIASINEAHASARSLDKYTVPSPSRGRTKPPVAMKEVKGWGNLDWFRPEPHQIINADTCDWYADYQFLSAKTRRSLCYFLQGKVDLAISDLEIITKVDTQDRLLTERNQPSNFLRLRDDYRSGRLYATKTELAEFKGRALAEVALAELLLETEQWDSALAAYASISKDNQLGLGINAKSYLSFATASILSFSGKPDAARERLTAIWKSKTRTVTRARAMCLLGDTTQDAAEQTAILEQVVAEYQGSEYELSALMRLGQYAYIRQQYPKAKTIFVDLTKKAKGTPLERGAQSYLLGIEQKTSTAAQTKQDKQ